MAGATGAALTVNVAVLLVAGGLTLFETMHWNWALLSVDVQVGVV
jgi:hypothetical protein